jgi:DnaJ-class molecular chaperone
MSAIECTQGCCPGCGECFGYGIGCHANPCTCGTEECEECHGEGAVVIVEHDDGEQEEEECEACGGTGRESQD